MVVSLGPGKFYGTSLPRPRIYNDVKFNDERVDPPVPVTDPFMSWASEAHWSMGGLSFKRLRLMGKIEGNVNKLRAEREKLFKNQKRSVTALASSDLRASKDKNVSKSERPSSISPPPAPVASKRRKFMALIDDDDDEDTEESSEEEEVRLQTKNRGVRRRLVKKLGDDFDRVASERTDLSDTANHNEMGSPLKGSNSKSESMVLRTRNRRSQKTDSVDVPKVVHTSNTKEKTLKTGKESKSQVETSPGSANGVRTSPRLAKRGSS
ncbi:hypothetical protein L6164_018705 [Bauhinia variegata]|uniref:Uncharacterized protein n=1 Tax=Bauhinia variegata TaxID=167791 RepID=A0ACB9NC90_BAUVA|nr:hypothetical protein L6164_018705 [Bauhinia variegata]